MRRPRSYTPPSIYPMLYRFPLMPQFPFWGCQRSFPSVSEGLVTCATTLSSLLPRCLVQRPLERAQQIVDHPSLIGADLGGGAEAGGHRHACCDRAWLGPGDGDARLIDRPQLLVLNRVAADPEQPALQRAIAGERKSRSEEHTSELQSLMRISYAVFCLKTKKQQP